MKAMVQIENGMLKIEELSIPLAQFPDGIVGVEILSPSYALVTLEAYTRILLAGYYLSLLAPFTQVQTFKAHGVTAHWNHEDSSGLYLEMSKKTSIGVVSFSINCWHDESSANMDLLEQFNKSEDKSLSLDADRANKFWEKKAKGLIFHVNRAERFSFDNTPEGYRPNREALEGAHGFNSTGLFPYSLA